MKKIIIFIVSLNIIDQSIKLLISNVLGDKQVNLISDLLHIHPVLNQIGIVESKLDIIIIPSIRVIIIVIGFFAIIFFYKFSLFISEKWRKLSTLFLCFFISGELCFCIDAIFWGGSLDYICLYWHSYDAILSLRWTHHLYFDLKDVYLGIGIALFLIRIFILLNKYYKLSKDERKNFDLQFKNYFKKCIKRNANL